MAIFNCYVSSPEGNMIRKLRDPHILLCQKCRLSVLGVSSNTASILSHEIDSNEWTPFWHGFGLVIQIHWHTRRKRKTLGHLGIWCSQADIIYHIYNINKKIHTYIYIYMWYYILDVYFLCRYRYGNMTLFKPRPCLFWRWDFRLTMSSCTPVTWTRLPCAKLWKLARRAQNKTTIINGNFRILKWRYLPYIRPI